MHQFRNTNCPNALQSLLPLDILAKGEQIDITWFVVALFLNLARV